MIWANKISPMFTVVFWGCQARENSRFLTVKVQVDTKINRATSRANAAFQLRPASFNWTAVISNAKDT
jgi:hypothetical protein